MLTFRYLEEAEDDADWEISRLDELTGRDDAGRRFQASVHQTILDICQMPATWPVWPDADQWRDWKDKPLPRSHGVRGYTYRIVYVVIANEVIVVAVASTRRKPAYWRSRGDSV